MINAHGGGVLYHEGKYYWFGEHRPESGFVTEKGINCYSSTDLLNWNYEGVVLPISEAKEVILKRVHHGTPESYL